MTIVDAATQMKIEEHKAEYPLDWQRDRRREYLLSYYRKAFEKQYLRSKKYIEDTAWRAMCYMDMQEKAIQKGQFETAFIMAGKVKECVQILKKYQDDCYFKRMRLHQDSNGNPKGFIVTEQLIERAKAFPISQLYEFNKHHMAACPFHQDKSPSMRFYQGTNSVFCFSCNKSWDSIAFYMDMHGATFTDAVRGLQ